MAPSAEVSVFPGGGLLSCGDPRLATWFSNMRSAAFPGPIAGGALSALAAELQALKGAVGLEATALYAQANKLAILWTELADAIAKWNWDMQQPSFPASELLLDQINVQGKQSEVGEQEEHITLSVTGTPVC